MPRLESWACQLFPLLTGGGVQGAGAEFSGIFEIPPTLIPLPGHLQGLYENFLNMKLRDSSFGSVCLALEWLCFSDMLSRAVLHRQSFQLMRYLPFLPVAFHLLFAATSIPRLSYPSSHHEVSTRNMQCWWCFIPPGDVAEPFLLSHPFL